MDLDRAYTLDHHAAISRASWVGIVAAACVLGLLIVADQWALAFALIGAALMLLWPVEVGLGLFAFIVPFEAVLAVGENTTINWAVGLAAGSVLLFDGFLTGRLQAPHRVARWWGALAIWSVFTVTWAIDSELAVQRVPTLASLFLFYLVVACYRMRQREMNVVVLLTIAGGALAAAYAVWQFRSGGGVLRATIVTEGQAANPNVFASTLLFPFALAIGQLLSRKDWIAKLAMLGAAATMTFAILLSMSRGALVSLAAVCLVFLFRFRVNWRILLPVAVLSALVFLAPDLFFERVSSSVQSRAEGRFDMWRVAGEALRHYGVFGAGLSNFPVAYTQFAGFAPVFRGLGRSPHNVYLGVWVETGILGLALFLAAIIAQLRALRDLIRNQCARRSAQIVAFEAGYIGILVHGLALALMWRKSFWLASMMASAFVVLQNQILSPAQYDQQVDRMQLR